MNTFALTLTAQELEDIRMAIIAKVLECDDTDSEKSDRLSALSNKLARVSVLGHA